MGGESMKTKPVLLMLMLAGLVPGVSHAGYMNPKKVIKEFKEGGHYPQGLPKVYYRPVDEVITPKVQKKIAKAKKRDAKKIQYGQYLEPWMPKSVDLRKFATPVESQFNGSCTAYGTIGGLSNLANQIGIKNPDSSERFHFNNYHQYNPYPAMESISSIFQIEDSLWPGHSSRPKKYNIAQFGRMRISEYEHLGNSVPRVLKALAAGYPVNMAASVPEAEASCKAVIPFTSPLAEPAGGHDVIVEGYQAAPGIAGGGYLIRKGSWGTDCHDQGYSYWPFAYCDKPGVWCDFWAMKSIQMKDDQEEGELKYD